MLPKMRLRSSQLSSAFDMTAVAASKRKTHGVITSLGVGADLATGSVQELLQHYYLAGTCCIGTEYGDRHTDRQASKQATDIEQAIALFFLQHTTVE